MQNQIKNNGYFLPLKSSSSLTGGKGNFRENEKLSGTAQGISPNTTGAGEFKRKLSKREKKELKKQEKMNKLKNKENSNKGSNGAGDEGVAEKLYTGKTNYFCNS